MNLRKRSILLILIILLFSNLLAIDEKGLKAGFNYSTITGSEMSNAEFCPNFSAGLFVSKRLNNWLVLQPELMLSSKGSNYDGKERLYIDNDADGDFDEDPFDLIDNDGDGYIDEDRPELYFNVNGSYKLYYLEIPILLKVSPFNFISNNLNLIFGPSFNILLDGNYEFQQDSYEPYKGDLTNLKTFDFSAIVGFVYSINNYKIELRVNQGLIVNNIKTAGEAAIESMENPEEIYGPTNENGYLYCRFEKLNGFNTSVSLLVSILF